MKTIPLVPTKSQINTAFVGIAVLGAVTVLIPGFFFISAFLLPVLICPLFGKPDKKTAIALILYSLLPAVAAFIQSGDAKLTLCILCPTAAPMLVTTLLFHDKRVLGLKNQREYLAAFIFGELMLLLWMNRVFPEGIIPGLRDTLVGWVENTPYKNSLLRALVTGRVLPVPDMGLEGPEAERELMLLFRSRLEESLRNLFCKLVTWIPLVASLFTLLRVTWLNGSFLLVSEENQKQVTVARPVVFSMLALRTRTVFLLCLVSELTRMLTFGGGTVGTLALLTGWSCQGILNLAGTASFLRMLRGKDRKIALWKGLLAGILFTLIPEIMLICLIVEHMDILMRRHSDEKNKEEEP